MQHKREVGLGLLTCTGFTAVGSIARCALARAVLPRQPAIAPCRSGQLMPLLLAACRPHRRLLAQHCPAHRRPTDAW